MYYIAQGFGILATVCCLILPLWKKKWMMLVDNAAANIFFILNLVFLGQIGSAVIVNLVSLVQVLISYWHVKTEKPVTLPENIVFLILYVGLGALGFHGPLDLLPIVASVFNMLAAFQRDEQKTRILILCNAATFCTYYICIGSTSMLAELLAAITTVVALIRYRRKNA